MKPAIETNGLTKIYTMRIIEGTKTVLKKVHAVESLDLDIGQGEVFGLLGVNGAGKTTTIRMLSTLLEPTSGTALVNGYDISRQGTMVRKSIGCLLPGERTHYWKLTAKENLRFFATLYGLESKDASKRITHILELVGLAERAGERVENYSSGMRQRLALARALVHDPPILILDEPTTGLDVHSARFLRQLVKQLAEGGKTVLLPTHNLQEAEEVSTRVGIIHNGRLVAVDTPERLKSLATGQDLVEVRCRPQEFPSNIRSPLGLINETLRTLFALTVEEEEDSTWLVRIRGRNAREVLPQVIYVLMKNGWQVTSSNVLRPRLEDVFVEITGKPWVQKAEGIGRESGGAQPE